MKRGSLAAIALTAAETSAYFSADMSSVRRASERGHFENSWLNANHSFSFGEYYDPDNMGYSNLRVLNDDTIAAIVEASCGLVE